jgi:hypothetical protein
MSGMSASTGVWADAAVSIRGEGFSCGEITVNPWSTPVA